MWQTEYLENIREKQSVAMKPIKGEVRRKPIIGEIVIIKDDDLPRGCWKIGRIQNLIESDVDEVHRAAVIVLSSGKTIKRPFRYIYPLEGNDDLQKIKITIVKDNKIGVSNTNNDLQGSETLDAKKSKPIRAAAIIARKRLENAMQ